MRHSTKSPQGFNLIELMITIAIIVILGSIAIPSYMHYNRRVDFEEILQVVAPYKDAVVICYQHTKKFTGCNGGTHKIPANINSPKADIASLKVKNGVITVIPINKNGVTAEDTYILTPSISNKTIVWMPSGGAVAKKYIESP